MIRRQIKENGHKKPNSYELAKLKKNFPQYFNNKGNFLLDKFKEMLIREDVDMEKGSYIYIDR